MKPLHPYTLTPLHPYTLTPLHPYTLQKETYFLEKAKESAKKEYQRNTIFSLYSWLYLLRKSLIFYQSEERLVAINV